MKIATILNAHNNTELVRDTIDTIHTFVGEDILMVVDGAAWETWGKDALLPVHKLEGFYHNYPRAPYRNLTLALKSAAEGWPDADWYCYCLRGNTLVETADCVKKIKEIKEGEIVKTHLGRFRKVTKTFKRTLKQRSPLIWIKTKHSTIKCTPEHPFFVCKNNQLEFVQAQHLTPADFLLYPNEEKQSEIDFDIVFNTIGCNGNRKKGSIKNGQSIAKVSVTNEIARFLGLYLAEGNVFRDGIMFTFNNEEKEFIQFIINTSNSLFGGSPTITKKWATQLRINVRALNALFATWFGKKANQKVIPSFVFDWSLKNKLQFIQGYFEGDGHYDKSKRQTPTTASKQLVLDLQKLTKSCGLNFKFWEQQAKTSIYQGATIKSGISYHIAFDKKSTDKFLDLLESESLNGYCKIPITFVECKKMGALSKEQRNVYNLEVEEDNSYIADCAAVHNCEYDVLFTSDAFKADLVEADANNVWCLGNDLRIADFKFPYLESMLGIKLTQSAYLLGCCVFYSAKFMQKLKEEDFFNKFLLFTNEFSEGFFPGYAQQGGYDFGEHLYPTLAKHYGGEVSQFARWHQQFGEWTGNFKRYPMRWQPEITWEDNFSEASIMHPVKYGDELRWFHGSKRLRKKKELGEY